ncbi:MAG: ABC transporter permease [Gammaproteobacteria bacterium]|jgi:capsular polysaccharide transport system permease protein|nr:ABC transporter permease [Gammaproteobacteria bacterium]MBP6052715.1 ABC transporter permease [Pseudomonadales bacterium]MBK6585043.1 ABC transporter permease [Gammaproteobacteria bacterium]MBK7168689.1 ABC transporter permease [Gammaproteobacteria bacterium]MBK7520244.1 ABC transporter permease [Gammaproteobacteria bacterium]
MPEVIPRSAFVITLSVWKALLLREALGRLFGRRAAWFWLLLEPLFHVGYLMLIFTVVRVRHVGGIATALWIMIGLVAYFMFQRASRQSMNAVGANFPLFVYRQVLPVDSVLVRAGLEGVIMIVVCVLLFAGGGLFGLAVIPADPLLVLEALFGMWLLGLGLGASASVAVEMVPEFGRLLSMLMRPLYILSGVIFPVASIPPPYRDWLLLNPMVHGIDAVRLGFAPYYHEVPGLSVSYLYLCALSLLLLGLSLQIAFAKRMVTQ